MQRIARGVPPAEQTKLLDRALDPSQGLSYQDGALNAMQEGRRYGAMIAWMRDAPNDALNQAFRKHTDRMVEFIASQLKSSDYAVFDKLDVGGQAYMFQVLTKNPNSDVHSLITTFNRYDANTKNKIVDALQAMGPRVLPEFLSRFADADGVNVGLLKGINKENLEFMRETYLGLADRTRTRDQADRYRQMAHYLKGWIEDHYRE
jgi:hypothetical protein